MSKVEIRLTTEKIFNGNMKKPGTVLISGEIPAGIEPHKCMNAIKLGETEMVEIAEKPAKKDDKKDDK